MYRQFYVLILFLLQESHVQCKRVRSDDNDPLQAVVDKLSSDLVNLQAQLTAQNARISDLNSQLVAQADRIVHLEAYNNRTVAFAAYLAYGPDVAASDNSVIPFREVMSNIGGGYNPSSSVFTAPFEGQYFFIVHADCTTDYRSIHVFLNDQVVIVADNDHGDGHVTGCGLLKLKVGDVVSARHFGNGGTVGHGRESVFSGFLVK